MNMSTTTQSNQTSTPSGTVQVSCRFRFQTENEMQNGGVHCIEYQEKNTMAIKNTNTSNTNSIHPIIHQTTFDNIFDEYCSQEMVYNNVGAQYVSEVLSGYNCTILTYGQTGSGKTFTILGKILNGDIDKIEDMGLLPRVLYDIFIQVSHEKNVEIEISVNALEIYQERLRDLLGPKNNNLKIREDKMKGIVVDGAVEFSVKDYKETIKILDQAIKNRETGSHIMNDESSRSHFIFTLTVSKTNSTSRTRQIGKLIVVDLAGSEMVRKTAAIGKRLEEAKYINKSLTSLGLVINALTDTTNKNRHIPYRDSKLTRLLQHSLGGNGKTHLILTCSTSSYNMEETLSTIRFGNRAKFIKNKPFINVEKTVLEYKQLLFNMKNQINSLSEYIKKLESKGSCTYCSIREGQQEFIELKDNKTYQNEIRRDVPTDDSVHFNLKENICNVCNEKNNDENQDVHRCNDHCINKSKDSPNDPKEFGCVRCLHNDDDNKEIVVIKETLEKIILAEDKPMDLEKEMFIEKIENENKILEEKIIEQERTIDLLRKKIKENTIRNDNDTLKRDNLIESLQHQIEVLNDEKNKSVDSNNAEVETLRKSLDVQQKNFEEQSLKYKNIETKLINTLNTLNEAKETICKLKNQEKKNKYHTEEKALQTDYNQYKINELSQLMSSKNSIEYKTRPGTSSIQTWWYGEQDRAPNTNLNKSMSSNTLVIKNKNHGLYSTNIKNNMETLENEKNYTITMVEKQQKVIDSLPFRSRLEGLLASLEKEI